jgi:hypothetical protein
MDITRAGGGDGVTKATIGLKIFIALVALALTLCSACGFYFSLRMSEIWLIAVCCFLFCGIAAFLLWKWFFQLGREKQPQSGSIETHVKRPPE